MRAGWKTLSHPELCSENLIPSFVHIDIKRMFNNVCEREGEEEKRSAVVE